MIVVNSRNAADFMDFNRLYANALDSYKACVQPDDNEDLQTQVQIPLGDIVPAPEWIKIQFFGTDTDHYITETRLKLLSQSDEEIGWYSILEDENGNCMDDYLVFE